MNRTKIIRGLGDVAAEYDALLCDAWGVVHNGLALYDGVAEAMRAFKAQGKPVIILTNAPRLQDSVVPFLDHLGLSRDRYDGVVTSGDATKAEVEKRKHLGGYRIGPAKDDSIFAAVGAEFVSLDAAGFILCTGLYDDAKERPEDYRDVLLAARDRNLPFVCANPDTIVHRGNTTLYCAGALAALYRTMGGEVIMAGKPYAPIYHLAFARLAQANNGQKPHRILAIGDGIDTDIAGANNQGLDTVFIAAGIFHAQVAGASGCLDQDRLDMLLHHHEQQAVYAMQELCW